MGVHGLWKLIDAAGKPVPVETLENAILAVDVSIWLHQLVKGFHDHSGASGANAHLLGLFYRILKLLFFRIKPVFVFDGGVPALKRNTIAARQSNRNKANESLEKVRQELLQNLLKQHALGKLLGQNVKIPKSLTTKQDNLFYLPPMPSSTSNLESGESAAGGYEDDYVSDDNSLTGEGEISSDSSAELSPRKKYGDIYSVDVNSKEFQELPVDIRHDILSELKETRKQNSWAKVHLMPEDVGDFSSFQMERLLKRRSVQVGLEKAEKEMGPRCFTVSEIREILEYQGVDVTKAQRIASDSSTSILYSSQKNEADKGEAGKTIKVGAKEEVDSDADDPLIDTLKANEDMSQEEILKLIKAEEARKKAREPAHRGNPAVLVNEPLDEISQGKHSHSEPGKILPESVLYKRPIAFDDRQVTRLLKDSAQKNILPISKVDKLLGGKRKKLQKKKIVRKVTEEGPKLSESSSDSDVPDKIRKFSESSEDENDKVDDGLKTCSVTESKYFKGDPPLPNAHESIEKEISAIKKIELSEIFCDKSPKSSDDDLEEVRAVNKTDSSSNDDFIDVPSSKEPIKGLTKKETESTKCFSIELNFKRPTSDEEDIFADIFKPVITQGEAKYDSATKINKMSKSCSLDCKEDGAECQEVATNNSQHLVAKKFYIETDLIQDNKEKLNSTRADNALKIFEEEIKRPHMKTDGVKVSEIYIDPKEAERAVILEELLITKKKLEEDMEISSENDSKNNEKSVMNRLLSSGDDEDLNEMKSKCSETQESLEEKEYFTDDKLVLQHTENKNEKSPNSFAKKLATVEQVRQFQSTLERESSSLIKEKRRDEKIAANLSEQITVEAQELLRMFGIPFLTAPMEAEAQCAFLDQHGLTQGTITDDSDIWLFGANNVYKNFFDQKKFVKLFKSNDIKRVFNLGRDELIMIGLLVGSDYTSGLNGVGPVTALEIVANFPLSEKDIYPARDRLARFASDFNSNKLDKKLCRKLVPVHLIEGFPSLEVVRAYTDPQVDNNEETFSWGIPDMERIRQYCMDKFAWDYNKTDQTLQPIIDKLKQSKTQTTLHGFFDWAFEDIQGKMSKRVESAVSLLGASPTKSQQQETTGSAQQTGDKEEVTRVSKKENNIKRKNTKAADSITTADSVSTADSMTAAEAGPSSAPSTSRYSPAAVRNVTVAGPVYFEACSAEAGTSSACQTDRKSNAQFVATLPRVNATIQKLKKGQSLSAKPRERKAKPNLSLLKPMSELNFDAPFGSGETRKRKKVERTDEEKWKEIEEARAKAAKVLAKLKNLDQFHGGV